MMRRSLRLLEAGYYTAEGSPSITYRERIYRIFRRRTRQSFLNRLGLEDSDENDLTVEHEETFGSPDGWMCEVNGTQFSRVRRNPAAKSILRVRSVSCFLFVLLLASETAYLHFQLKAVELELTLRSERMETCCPLADTMANFALRSQGAQILSELSSDTYRQTECNLLARMSCSLFKLHKANVVIKGHSVLRMRDSWCFSGDRGRLVIALSDSISISHVTLGHITKSQSPSGFITSAPREFSVYGMQTAVDEGSFLVTAVFDENGPGFQTFALPNPDGRVFSHVKILFHNNWGNSRNTCIYAFRVHGKLPAEL